MIQSTPLVDSFTSCRKGSAAWSRYNLLVYIRINEVYQLVACMERVTASCMHGESNCKLIIKFVHAYKSNTYPLDHFELLVS